MFGGVGFLSLNADLERADLPQARQVIDELKAQLLKNGLEPATFARLQQAAIARQAWAVQGNSALADYYWGALSDYADGRFSDPAKRLKAVSLKQANLAMRKLLEQPGYLRIEKPLLSYAALSGLILGALLLIVLALFGWRAYRQRIRG